MAGIKPDRADSGIDAALDIRGQTVPDDYCCFLMEIRDSGETAVKVFPAWFIVSQFFGDKNILKVTGNSGTFKPSLLDT